MTNFHKKKQNRYFALHSKAKFSFMKCSLDTPDTLLMFLYYLAIKYKDSLLLDQGFLNYGLVHFWTLQTKSGNLYVDILVNFLVIFPNIFLDSG